MPGCREASGEGALYVPPGDATALAAAVERLLRDEGLRARTSAAALQRAPLFDEDRWLDGLVALYGRAASKEARS